MESYQLIFSDASDYLLSLKVVEAAGFHIAADGRVTRLPETLLTAEERQQHLRIIAKGGSGTSIPDPVAWQREIRADRPLPDRD